MADADKRFKVTYCSACGYKERAEALSSQLEKDSSELCALVPSNGGVFEVEDKGILIFSKTQSGRFPEDGEVLNILNKVKAGQSLQEAQTNAAHEAGHSGGVLDWIYSLFRAQPSQN